MGHVGKGVVSECSLTYRPSMTPRAPALPPDQRRAAISTAALGVLRRKGNAATTREIAEAAGVAEGTLFRAFGTKEDLVCAAMEQAFEPTPVIAQLAAIDAALPLRERLVVAVGVIQARYLEVFELMHAMGIVHPPDSATGHRHAGPGAHASAGPWRQQMLERLVDLVEPDSEQLRVSADELVDLIVLLSFAGSHHTLTQGRILAPDTIVDVLLDGTRKVS